MPLASESPEPTRLLTNEDLPSPVEDRWFEDYLPGRVYEFGHVGVTEAEIVEFAQLYDPQAIHLDVVGATEGPFGGLIASGVHTLALTMRLYVTHYVSRVASLASPGLDELRWTRPVRPGDRLKVRISVTDSRRLASRADRGLVHTSVETLDQDEETVLTFAAMNFFAVRPARP